MSRERLVPVSRERLFALVRTTPLDHLLFLPLRTMEIAFAANIGVFNTSRWKLTEEHTHTAALVLIALPCEASPLEERLPRQVQTAEALVEKKFTCR
jgi:hypothetical protein